MEIIVTRDLGNLPGDDIIDPLLATEPAGVSRGRAELDFLSTAKEPVRLQIVYRSNLKTGQLVEVHDALQGVSWRGKITSISHKITNTLEPSIFTELSVEKPSDFYPNYPEN